VKICTGSGSAWLSLGITVLLVFVLLHPDTVRGQEKQSPHEASESPSKAYLFRFLIVPGKTKALIDSVRVVDGSGRTVAFLDAGADDDQSGACSVAINNENQWGEKKKVDACTCRGVNEGNGKSQHSSFTLTIEKPRPSQKYKIVVKYKDDGEDLLPLEVFDGQEFRRIAQILLENSGGWLEETFSLPARLLK